MENKPNKQEDSEIPYGQKLYESPITLLILGLVVMFVFYTIWGMIEIMTLQPGTLP